MVKCTHGGGAAGAAAGAAGGVAAGAGGVAGGFGLRKRRIIQSVREHFSFALAYAGLGCVLE